MLILFFYLCLALPSGSFLEVSNYKPVCTSLLSHAAHFMSLLCYMVNLTVLYNEQYKLCTPSLRIFFLSPISLSHLGPDTFLSKLYSGTARLCYSCNVTDHLFKTLSQCVLISTLLDSKRKVKIFFVGHHSLNVSTLNETSLSKR
jgi:hypothetical protein